MKDGLSDPEKYMSVLNFSGGFKENFGKPEQYNTVSERRVAWFKSIL
jgi:hypothetical protein